MFICFFFFFTFYVLFRASTGRTFSLKFEPSVYLCPSLNLGLYSNFSDRPPPPPSTSFLVCLYPYFLQHSYFCMLIPSLQGPFSPSDQTIPIYSIHSSLAEPYPLL